MRLRFVFGPVLIGGFAWLAGASALHAQNFFPGAGTADGIAVSGKGEIFAHPNLVEIDLNVSGKAELTGDALVKYRDAKKRVLDALDKLKLKGMTTDERALTISAGNTTDQQQRFVNGMPQAPGKNQVEVASVLRVRLKEIRDIPPDELLKTIGKLLDVAQDAGVTIGPTAAEVARNMRFGNNTNTSTLVRFVVADLAEIREKAYEQAVADARLRATRLAKLNNVKLGAAISVQEIAVAGDQPQAFLQNQFGQAAAPTSDDEKDEPRIVATTHSGIPVQVRLMVRPCHRSRGTRHGAEIGCLTPCELPRLTRGQSARHGASSSAAVVCSAAPECCRARRGPWRPAPWPCGRRRRPTK